MRRLTAIALSLLTIATVNAQVQLNDAETAIEKRMGSLRSTPDNQRGAVTKQIALDIRQLPASKNKVLLATGLANLSTEGDFGHGTLQAVADTLAGALEGLPKDDRTAQGMDFSYSELAQLQRYEHVTVNLEDPLYVAAQQKVDATNQARAKANFTLTDLNGHAWTLSDLKGKVVLVNFWATWCPPCRKEMPDMGELYGQFKDQGLVVLAISDEKAPVVTKYIQEHKVPYTILLDEGRHVNELYQVDGIPKSFIYDRKGRLVAQAMDMRTKHQFLDLLAKAGLK